MRLHTRGGGSSNGLDVAEGDRFMPMPPVLVRSLFAACALTAAAAPVSAHATHEAADDAVAVLVLRENGAGSAASAQRYIDEIMQQVAKLNGWAAAKGSYQTSRSVAASWIAEHDPHYGILSLTAFLSLRGKHKLEVVGKADVKGGGGEQYFLVSKTARDLAGCKGQKVATNHADDMRFIDRVVADGFSLKDFELVKTPRPLQTIKKVLRDEATCALIDDAQRADLANVDGGAALQTVWSSAKLPPMVVVAFPSAPAAEAKAFKQNLAKVCKGAGQASCAAAGIESLAPADEKAYAAVIKSYDK
jgi:hypothetical protein